MLRKSGKNRGKIGKIINKIGEFHTANSLKLTKIRSQFTKRLVLKGINRRRQSFIYLFDI